MNNDWIELPDGSECPVDGNAYVEVVLRSGAKMCNVAKFLRWNNVNGPGDIMRYKVISTTLREQYGECKPGEYRPHPGPPPQFIPVQTVVDCPTTPPTAPAPEPKGPLTDLDHTISTAIQMALRRGVSADSITALLTEINIEFKNARPYIEAALKPRQTTEKSES